MKRQIDMSPEELEQEERRMAEDLRRCRVRFVEHVRAALTTPSPTRRKELYQRWRQDYGDNIARSYAKYAEACFAGHVSIKDIEKMVKD